MFQLAFDPISLVLEIANKLYPELEAVIYWVHVIAETETEDGEAAYGATVFPPKGSEDNPTIVLSLEMPLGDALEVLSHEVAHVVAGAGDGHGPKWKAAFEALHEEYLQRIQEIAGDDLEVEIQEEVAK